MSSTRTRIISAVVAALIVIALYIIAKRDGLTIVAILATLGAQYEFIKLCIPNAKNLLKLLFFVFSAAIYASISMQIPDAPVSILAISFMCMSIFVMLLAKNNDDNKEKQSLISTTTMGFIYVGVLPGITTQLILNHSLGLQIFFICILTVITTDVMAYFVGRKFGKAKLLPTISPNKTKAGSFAGSLSALVMACVMSWLLGLQDHIVGLTIAGFIASIFSQFGDLFESVLKRNAGKKDSGRIMPGHGGYLDRLDSILFSFPIFYCYVTWFV
ncbi:MAG: phosphatidate cytidylyltransferase [Bdellovibrionales bacterium]|nr:phosphatidate cytidylyltransferase [Bdellovibrionales bacterium]